MKKIIAFVLVCVLALSVTGCGNSDYDEAVKLYEAGSYTEAEALLAELGDYKDSVKLRQACRYGQAVELYEAKEYEEAEKLFKKLGSYEDSAEMLNACYYARAVAMQEAGDLRAALELYAQAGGYADSKTKILECRELYAAELMAAGEYGKALPHLKALDKAEVLGSESNAVAWCTLAAFLQENRGFAYSQSYTFSMRLTQEHTIEILAHMASDDNTSLVVDYSVSLGYNEDHIEMAYSYSMRNETKTGRQTRTEWGKEDARTIVKLADFTPENVYWDHIRYEGEDVNKKPVTEPMYAMNGSMLSKLYKELGSAVEKTGLGITLRDLGFISLPV